MLEVFWKHCIGKLQDAHDLEGSAFWIPFNVVCGLWILMKWQHEQKNLVIALSKGERRA